MDDDLDLRHFSGTCRLFPLPRVVLFPHAVLPLHIFEPRYRQMTEDALAGDRLVTMVQLRPPTQPMADALGSPPIETVACVGRILQHERLPDGRFNFLLVGKKRVRLRREVASDRLYRLAEAEILDDIYGGEAEEPLRDELVSRFRSVITRDRKLDPDLASLLDSTIPLGILTDILAHALPIPSELKQVLLADTLVERRAEVLVKLLRGMPDPTGAVGPGDPGRGFPAPFSLN